MNKYMRPIPQALDAQLTIYDPVVYGRSFSFFLLCYFSLALSVIIEFMVHRGRASYDEKPPRVAYGLLLDIIIIFVHRSTGVQI